jgi:hypothetical protein
VRELQPSGASRQLALPVAGCRPLDAVWESLGPEAREQIVRLLAAAIAHILSDAERRR